MTATPTSPPRADDDDYGRDRSGTGSHTPSGAGDVQPVYDRFVASVVAAQLQDWLPAGRSRLLDISRDDASRGSSDLCTQMADQGHDVIRAVDARSLGRRPQQTPAPGIRQVVGDVRSLDWFRTGCVDGLVAEGSALSDALATETTVEQAARLLRPGGRLLLSVDSLLFGLARLAEQHRWPELADAGAGDVVLVPDGGDGFTRCFGPDELAELVGAAGFAVDWIRPRTVLPPDVVGHAVAADATVIEELVATELRSAREREGEALGLYLALSATRL